MAACKPLDAKRVKRKNYFDCSHRVFSNLGAGEGELVTLSLEFEFHLQFPCGSPSTELKFPPISPEQKRARMGTNID